jgi:triosephosphate isomerase
MRTPIIAGNWKMHKTVAEATKLAQEVCNAVADMEGVDVVFWEEQGAFTGEVSPLMLQELCDYVILGHSERRQFFGETDEGVNRKIKAALTHNLTPIVCVGENLAQNEAGETAAFVGGQVKAAFEGLSAEDAVKLVVAYEPIWAIGTGKNADPTTANSIIGLSIRGALAEMYNEDVAQQIRVQYGGSVKPDNVKGFMAQPDIDGALVGGASLKVDNFLPLIKAAL